MTESSYWDRARERAVILRGLYPAAAQILGFYHDLLGYQKAMAADTLRELNVRSLADLDLAAPVIVQRFADEAGRLLERHAAGEDAVTGEFKRLAVLQPLYHALAPPGPKAARAAVPGRCPFCSGAPLVGVLRESGDSAERSMVCELCLSEWSVPRVACVECGETKPGLLPRYTADQIPHVHVEACDRCKTYVKVVDLTIDGEAVPIVDDLATLALDMVAREKGYSRPVPNFAGV